MRRSAAKRLLTVILLVINVVLLLLMQPVFFGARTYFGVDPRLVILPVSFITIVIICLHLYQNWPLALAWFRKSPDKKKQAEKMQRLIVLLAFIIVLGYDIVSAWYEALTSSAADVPIESMRVWSWVATGLLAVHVWQRWRLTFSYFKRSPRGKAA